MHIEESRTAKVLAKSAVLLYLAAGAVVHFSSEVSQAVGDFPLYLAISVGAVLTIILSGYCLYLVIDSIGTGYFPGPAAKLPSRSGVVSGVPAVAFRILFVIAAAALILIVAMYAWRGWSVL